MDIYAFPPIAAVLDTAHALLTGLATALTPVAGSAAAALAIVLVTLVVRAVLVPLGVAQVRAEAQRRRLAPKLSELQRRHNKNPELLQRKTLELYREEKTSPFAGTLPALAQAPVLGVLYGIFVLPVINGHPNTLLDETLLGVQLGRSVPAILGSATPFPDLLVPLTLLIAMAAVAFVTRSQAIRLAEVDSGGMSPTVTKVMASLAFLSVLFAAIVPLAATIYLAVSTTWTLVERTALRRRVGILVAASGRPHRPGRGGSEVRPRESEA